MIYSEEEIRRRLRLGEDSRWEFKQIVFSGDVPKSPGRDALADEITAFANAAGGTLWCGVTDDRQVQGMTEAQMVALDRQLVEICTDGITPPVCIETHGCELDRKAFRAVRVPKGDDVHDYNGMAYIRDGVSKRRLTSDERYRLAQRRNRSRFLWFDEQPVPGTGFGTLDPALWRPLISAEGAANPRTALEKLALLARDEAHVVRATVTGVLICTQNPSNWLPNAIISATHYRGVDRTSGQIDAREITGPLDRQIRSAVAFVLRNMQVAALKTPARVDMPQYSEQAIFEAVVNAVVHRDYSIRGSRIRLSLFSDRLEIQSPGALPNNLTLDSIALRQATRNQTVATLMGQMAVRETPGVTDRVYFMGRRGDGVPAIQRETWELAGRHTEYRLIDDTDVLLVMPAAPQEPTPARTVVTVRCERQPVEGWKCSPSFPMAAGREPCLANTARVHWTSIQRIFP